MRYANIIRLFRLGSEARVGQQTMWMGAITAVQAISGIVMVILTARILGPEGFGVFSIFIATAAVFHGFISAPGHETITAFVTRDMIDEREASAAQVLRLVFIISLALALCAYILFSLVTLTASKLIGISDIHTSEMLVCGLASLLMTTHLECLAALRLANLLTLGFIVIAIGAVFRSIALLVVWILDGNLMMTSMVMAGAAAVTGVGLLASVMLSSGRGYLPRFLSGWSIKVSKEVARYHLISFYQSKFAGLFANLDVVLLGALIGPTQAGFYRAARGLVDTTLIITQPIALSLQTEYSRRWYGDDGATVPSLSRRFTIAVAVLAVIIYGSLIIGHQPIVLIALGPEFRESTIPLLVMIPGAFVSTIVAALRVLPAATGHAMPSLIWTTAALVAQVAVLVVLAPVYGANGAALAYTVYHLVFGILVFIFSVALLRRINTVGD